MYNFLLYKVDLFKNIFNFYFSKFVILIYDLKWFSLNKNKMLLIEIYIIFFF